MARGRACAQAPLFLKALFVLTENGRGEKGQADVFPKVGTMENTVFTAWRPAERGEFVLQRATGLFRNLLSSWPRRGHTMLHVGCGKDCFLHMFWEDGFDVTGLESDTHLLSALRERLGNRVECQLGQYDCLPYDDESFDYVVLPWVLNLEPSARRRAILAEAVRVAGKGVLLGFVNSWHISGRRGLPRLAGVSSLTPAAMFSLLKPWFSICVPTVRFVLAGPCGSWRLGSCWKPLNSVVSCLPFGALAGVRLDRRSAVPLTPLWLHAGAPARESSSCGACTMSGTDMSARHGSR